MVAATRPTRLLDAYGQPIPNARERAQADLVRLRREVNRSIRARYDAAQTVTSSENHWAQADRLSPDAANSWGVRRILRSRSRYEIIENNPYLKGVILSLVNDFIGSGPKLQVTDKRLSEERRRLIQRRWNHWAAKVRLRKKLWRLRLARSVDGEGFLVGRFNPGLRDPIKLDCINIEADRVTSEHLYNGLAKPGEIDGIRFDKWDNPRDYYILDQHPGAQLPYATLDAMKGQWIKSPYVLHWFRQDRGWSRGIPEATPSLPLCALLRRYTLAVVRAAEIAADFAGILETEGPPGVNAWTDGQGNMLRDDPFDQFPVEAGMLTTLPWGYKLHQMEARQPGSLYDGFVDALLREIVRPLLVPFNRAAGSSANSNMASAVVDEHIYKSGIWEDRRDCNEAVVDPLFDLWWWEALRANAYLDDPLLREPDLLAENPTLWIEPPEHTWRWDRIGIDHTDPLKVAKAMETYRKLHVLTDRDIQETYYNRDVDEWRDEVREDLAFEEETGPRNPEPDGSRIEDDED